VSTNLLGITPGLGSALQRIVIGGADYGHHTLSRFFALHAGVLPGAVIALVAIHVYLFRRHGITAKQPLRKKDEAFWPEQVLKDVVACLAVLATVLFLIILPRLRDPHAPFGAELGAPADPSQAFSAARPEWYFLFLFQFLKYFPGTSEIIGAIIIPSVVLGVIFLMPVIGRWRLGHRFNVGFLFAVLAGAVLLTYLAKAQDRNDPAYQAAVRAAEDSAERVRDLASGGIPREGALALLQNDPQTQGPKIFARNCASCHRYGGSNGQGVVSADQPSASDLKGFASREWLAGLLNPDTVDSVHYFGGTKLKDGKMVRFVKKTIFKLTPEEKTQLPAVIAALSAEAQLPSQTEMDSKEAALIAQGRTLINSDTFRCTECHQFRQKTDDATAPDLSGYGSAEWLAAFVRNPADERFYGKKNDRMPAFGHAGRLDEKSLGLVVAWLRGEGQAEVAGPLQAALP
jgi:ubiquinol-cytochrome c reductase cytochrome b subunit